MLFMFSGVRLQNLTTLVTTLLLHIPVCVSSLWFNHCLFLKYISLGKKQSEIMKIYDFHGFPVLGCSFAELVETWSVPCHGDIDCVCRNEIKI